MIGKKFGWACRRTTWPNRSANDGTHQNCSNIQDDSKPNRDPSPSGSKSKFQPTREDRPNSPGQLRRVGGACGRQNQGTRLRGPENSSQLICFGGHVTVSDLSSHGWWDVSRDTTRKMTGNTWMNCFQSAELLFATPVSCRSYQKSWSIPFASRKGSIVGRNGKNPFAIKQFLAIEILTRDRPGR